MTIEIIHGDMLVELKRLKERNILVQSVVTDAPYHLTSIVKRWSGDGTALAPKTTDAYARTTKGFMGKKWDGGDIAFRPETWRLCFDLLPPGGHLVAFSGTRTYHRMACAIEDAGFEIRDMLAWMYGSGFPKSLNIAKVIDRAAGIDTTDAAWQPVTDLAKEWAGHGTALKPGFEPICLARKPIEGTVMQNVLKYGTGALNVDACRIEGIPWTPVAPNAGGRSSGIMGQPSLHPGGNPHAAGRWPANVLHDGSDEVLAAFPVTASGSANVRRESGADQSGNTGAVYGAESRPSGSPMISHGDAGSASRFFYSSKADADDRLGSKHPTVKPVDVIGWLVKMITPKGGTVLDPFAGSGTTGMACMAEGFDCIMVEAEAEYVADIRRRLAHVRGDDTPLFSTGGDR